MASVEKAQAALKVANADFIPDVNIFGSYFNQTAASYIQPNFGAFGVSASYTFFDWGKRRRVKDQREIQIMEASYNFVFRLMGGCNNAPALTFSRCMCGGKNPE